MAKKKAENKVMTRAQKTEAVKGLVKELLAVKPHRHNELIDEVAKSYAERYHGEDTENANDVKGRVGSVLDIMKKESEVIYDGGMYALKARMPSVAPEVTAEVKPAPKKRGRAKKTELTELTNVESTETVEEKPAPKKRGRAKKTVEPTNESTAELTPVKEESVTPPIAEEKSAPKKRGRKPKAKAEAVETERLPDATEGKEEVSAEEKTPQASVAEETKSESTEKTAEQAVAEEKTAVSDKEMKTPETEKKQGQAETPKTETVALVEKPKAEIAPKTTVMDMSFLFGSVKSKNPATSEKQPKFDVRKNETNDRKEATKVAANVKTVSDSAARPAAENTQKKQEKTQGKQEQNKAVTRTANATVTESKSEQAKDVVSKNGRGRQAAKPATAEEKLREAYLKRMRALGGDYFEYYSVYLLERYSMKNGRRLEGLRITGGDHDGGIDGEIELTDKFGFKETIYIQSKNWDPEKGKGDKWVVGETLLQQFIGACACRQAKDGKQHCRGIFVTTSRFTPEAKRILDDMSDKIVGYDGEDLYEAAKECEFGLIKKNGEWALDEKLLSGDKAFFNMF